MAAAQLEEKKKSNEPSTSKMGVRVVPIPAVSPAKGFVCTATGLVIPGRALFVGHLPFISPFAALVFFKNMDAIFKAKLDSDVALVKHLGLTSRFISMCISRVVSPKYVNIDKVDAETAGKRGKRSAHTEFATLCIEAAVQSGLAYTAGSPFFIPIAACINEDRPAESYIECLRLICNLLQAGRALEERFEWSIKPVTTDAYQKEQRDRRQPKPFLVFKCADESTTPHEVVSEKPSPFEDAFEFFKNLLGRKGSFSAIDDPKTPASKRFAGIAEDNTRYLCTNKYHKDHLARFQSSSSSSSSLTSSNDDDTSDGELSQPVEDD